MMDYSCFLCLPFLQKAPGQYQPLLLDRSHPDTHSRSLHYQSQTTPYRYRKRFLVVRDDAFPIHRNVTVYLIRVESFCGPFYTHLRWCYQLEKICSTSVRSYPECKHIHEDATWTVSALQFVVLTQLKAWSLHLLLSPRSHIPNAPLYSYFLISV